MSSQNVSVEQCFAWQGAIWDLDGTLLDSLAYWNRLGADYLATKGILAPDDLQAVLDTMELREGVRYLKERFHLTDDSDTVFSELKARIRHVYTDDATFFPGALAFLQKQYDAGVKLALFTSAEGEAAQASLERNGALQLFSCIVSASDLDLDKSKPEAFLYVLERLGTELEHTVVYEDSEYAIQGAKLTGMTVIIKPQFT